jgi:O-antigen/teichoic acid export membrane protein
LTQLADNPVAQSRAQGVIHASLAGALFQGIYALSQFIILAALLRYIGPERFGMWTTIWSIAAWGLVAHLGIGHALLTSLGKTATADPQHAGRILTAALLMVGSISLALAILTATIAPLLDWPTLLNVQDPQAVAESSRVALLAILLALAGLPASLAGTALLACQRGRASYASLIAAHLACAAAVVLGVNQNWSLTQLTCIILSPPIIAGIAQWTLLLTGPHAIHLRKWDRTVAHALIATGAGFFIMELVGIGLMQTGPFIIAQRLGAIEVTPYAAIFRLIGLVLAIYTVVVLAYWPAFGDAAQRNDHAWFAAALKWSLLKTLSLFAVAALGIYLFANPFISWWLGPEALPTTSLKIWMIVFVGLQGLFLWTTTPLKGLGQLRSQIISGVLMTAAFIPLAVWLCDRYAAAAVPIAQSIVILSIGLPVNLLALRRAWTLGINSTKNPTGESP